MSEIMLDPLKFYGVQSPMSDPGENATLFADLPHDVPKLCQIVQGLMVHVFWAERYGLKLTEERQQEVQLRKVAQRLARIQEMGSESLTIPRPLERRVVGNCRDFSLLLCSMLRYQGIPARARCGFGTYFLPHHYEDHWICEYWHEAKQAWITVDPQLDAFQCDVLKIDFDPCEIPKGRFISGGKAWQMCRGNQADPEAFGIFDMHGLWFVRGNLVRDVASLNKMELLPWDTWGIMETEHGFHSENDLTFLDELAELSLLDNRSFASLRDIYESDPRIRVPKTITTYLADGAAQVVL